MSSLPTPSPGMDISSHSTSTPQPSVKRCSTCKITKISLYSTFKNCPECRNKNRAKKRISDERARQRKLNMLQEFKGQDSDDQPQSTNDVQNRRVSDPTGLMAPKTIVTTSGGVKRKATKALHDLDKDEQRVVLAILKNGLKQTVKGNKRVVTPTRITSVSGEGKEYQTASAIYDVLKRRVTKATNQTGSEKRLHFHGFHAIIAMPTIDNEKRVSMVANDLRKIARIPFDHTKPSPSYNFETMGRTSEYRCTCLGYDTSVPTPAPAPLAVAKTTMKGTQGDLIRQARQRAAVDGSAVTTPRFCGGKVKITAVNDGRHPLGILAQRISISVEHPTPVIA